MNYLFIVGVALGIIVLVLLLKMVKHALKLFLYLVVIFLIVGSVFGYFLVKDVNNVITQFNQNKTMLLVKENTEFIVGIIKQGNLTEFVEDIELKEAYFANNEYDRILGQNNLLVILDISNISTNNTVETVENLPDEFKEYAQFAAMNQVYALVKELSEDPALLIQAYKDNSLIIYPETLAFRTLRFLSKLK